MNNFFVLNNSNENIAVNENFAGYIIFFKKNKDDNIASIQLNLLIKLIENALKLSLDNFLFVDLNTQKVRLSELRKLIKVNKSFLFGVNESEIGINIAISNYQLNSIADIEFLKADALEIIEKNTKLKAQLWQQLQISFKIV